MANFYSIITNRGKELEAEALASGTKITLVKFVVGDGNGQATQPKPTQTKLVNEKYRGDIADLSVSPEQSTQMMAKIVLPTEVGGFTVREIGILTDAGELYAVANCAAIEKPVGGVSVNMQFRLAVSDTANITLNVATGDGLFLRIDQDLSEIRGRGAQAQKAARESLAVVDASTKQKGLVQLSSATDSSSETLAATPKAVKAAYDKATEADERAKTADDNAGKANQNANGRLAKDQNGADIPNKSKFIENLGLNDTVNKAANALPIIKKVLSVDLNTLGHIDHAGVYYQSSDVNATADKHYPIQLSGTLSVTPSAYGCQQEYTTYSASRKFLRSLSGVWNGSGPWSPWVEAYSESHKPTPSEVGAVPSAGGSVGYLDNARYYDIKADTAPRGSGAWNDQLNSGAPFYAPDWAWTVNPGGHYVPLVKGVSTRAGIGYPCAVSFGYLLPGDDTWANPIIHAKGDNSECTWEFNINTGEILSSKAGGMSTQTYAQERANEAREQAKTWAYQNLVSKVQVSDVQEYIDIPYSGQTYPPAGASISAIDGATKSTGSGISFHISRIYFRRLQHVINGIPYNIA
ncbi:phage tail-collar fiber domain-containing protein [Hafnia paralvei]|uniref:phage tail-collar fiber domain-containing protein n=1 Tax=Hafnia paralvei TaxID=546367 RepID=UPI001F25D264|nr:phage tail protein [Hafnia paralvei]MCE9902513.1 phage tail protein [Hafnia paralvei]MCE9921786.1 phage tail protein [Hafnia paralvei]